jgi:WXXGXW repeat (2 copies)
MNTNRFLRLFLIAAVLLGMSAAASAGVFISVNFGPPALPVYEQPPCPAEGYMWTPGYWAYGPDGYYWVPGTWVLAPQPGFLWTPGYWGWNGGIYYWHAGYWGPTVGFYGGVAYGFGYTGAGFYGGEWRANHFYYNQNVTTVNVVNVHNTYNTTVINNTTVVNHVSYNGGPGGVAAQPTPEQVRYAAQPHVEATAAQVQHETAARSNPQLRASVNQGRPAIAATTKPGEFTGRGVVSATRAGATTNAAISRPNNVPRPGNASPAVAKAAAPAAPRSVPRPSTSYQPTSSRVNNTPSAPAPRPQASSAPSNAPRTQSAPHPQPPPKPQPKPPHESSHQ